MEYAKALTEVDEILDHLSKEDYKKIPKEVIDLVKQYKDKNYVWKYDETKKLKDQNVRKDTIAFLSYINMEYLVNEGQREFLERLHEINEEKLNKKNVQVKEDLFKEKKSDDIETNNIENEEVRELVVVKNSVLSKIFNKIRSFFKRGKKINVQKQIEKQQEERKNIVIPPKNSDFYESIKNGSKVINLLKKLQTKQIAVEDLNDIELDEMITIYSQQVADKEQMIRNLKK